tara:strand:+ start:98 stop:319 length:222 start_codon:yes stop_codon:yes gene_type:complete
MQSVPDAGVPFVQVHCFVAHCLFCVALPADDWYCAPVHTVHAVQAAMRCDVASWYVPDWQALQSASLVTPLSS